MKRNDATAKMLTSQFMVEVPDMVVVNKPTYVPVIMSEGYEPILQE